ncbi:prepilin-type N-terminal cleavage/methylation domain-containing protein [Candidatus Azambacteria bacterium]|nr:prepilin-type N-terminal cleavage/methylation domain-containing protein [Candidatus Azambacteria bacterium]
MKKLLATRYSLHSERGYSLIELMVAIGVFGVVVTIMSGTFMISLRGQGKSATMQNIADNARYAMEVMAKEMRMGMIKASEGYVLNASSDIQFRSNMPNRNGAIVRFYLDVPTGQIMFDDDISDALTPEPITAANIAVSALTFDVSGASSLSQPRITIAMQAASAGTAADVATRMDLQTTISPRSL